MRNAAESGEGMSELGPASLLGFLGAFSGNILDATSPSITITLLAASKNNSGY